MQGCSNQVSQNGEAEKPADYSGKEGRVRRRVGTEVERDGGIWRGRKERSIVCPDSNFASHDHDSQVISLIIQ